MCNFETTRARNAKAIAAFGVTRYTDNGVKTMREGKSSVTIYTIGYERRDGDGLIAVLTDHGIKALADVRERPMSRKPDFRASALKTMCESVRIEYQPWPELGSTVEQREELQQSGDFAKFEKRFRAMATKSMGEHIHRLGRSVARKPTALLCYEREHCECHRSVIAEMVANLVDATVIAL